MEVERQGQLEALASSNDHMEMIQYQAIARWIGFLIDELGLKHEVKEARLGQVSGANTGANDNPYMEDDSELRPQEM